VPRGISFDRVASCYDATRSLPPEAEAAIAETLAALLGPVPSLEIGVGTARWARAIELRGVPVYGIDLSPAMLRVGRAKGFHRAVQGDVSRLPFRSGSFRAVLSNHLLHLVRDVPAVLLEVARVLDGSLWSILDFEKASPDIMQEYSDRVTERFAPTGPPGLPERELARRLPPDRLVLAREFELEIPADRAIAELESRAFRDTWATPAPLHQAVIDELRARYAGTKVRAQTRVQIAAWSRARILEFARAGLTAPARSTP
jgi:SAM-dependent methyltransferase